MIWNNIFRHRLFSIVKMIMSSLIVLFSLGGQILYLCVAQYTIMPVVGAAIGKFLGLAPALSVGLILLGCCPGGIASSVVICLSFSSFFIFFFPQFSISKDGIGVLASMLFVYVINIFIKRFIIYFFLSILFVWVYYICYPTKN